ncbi:DUF3472 domain-containing protein [Aquimarina sp. TRL1]|uniref:DUF3472 domain-containing protein n=1 Tax=Aquimarina sp. (strain TRL1) TaxID=2736252 RepID=UPI00158875E4|nr:DUF3472 domain-containing protein [Aquimarina sp. TRL1]QKX06964.1 DUF3472 domain-containing protein [Aquimarina sp. TRL1]
MKFLKLNFAIIALTCYMLAVSCSNDNDPINNEEQTAPNSSLSKNPKEYTGDCNLIDIYDRFNHYVVGDIVKYRQNSSIPYNVYQKTTLSWTNLGKCSENPVNPDINFTISVATQGNTWVVNNPTETLRIVGSNGITNWNNKNTTARTYFYIKEPGTYAIGINARVQSGTSQIEASFGNQSKTITLNNTTFKDIYIGELEVLTKGYYYLDLKGITKTSYSYADVKAVMLGGNATDRNIKFVKNDIHFGRRGPSVHLGYVIPTSGATQAFYNEVEVQPGQDAVGSFYMVNGFQHGYFGIQVNSNTERRILFSVWSPYSTDNPGSIPEEYRIKLLKKGANVITQQFGGEGSGGQSYKVYNWNAGVRYKFLLVGKPAGNNHTDFTAYFMDPTIGTWDLIASFRRPKTNSYITNQYSFLENFNTSTGAIERSGAFYNQWVYDTNNTWHEITQAKFTYDATAENEFRFDYSGGVHGSGFFLKNCGFFNGNISKNTTLERNSTGNNIPKIDFSTLE